MTIDDLYEIEYDDEIDFGPVTYDYQVQRMTDGIQRPVIWNGVRFEPQELAEHLTL